MDANQGRIESARDRFKKACDSGCDLGCAYLGMMEFRKGNESSGEGMIRRVYEKGDMFACFLLAEVLNYKLKPGVINIFMDMFFSKSKKRNEESIKLYEKACMDYEFVACRILGKRLYSRGQKERGLSYLLDACKMDHFPSCHDAGRAYDSEGKGLVALKMFKKGCNGRFGDACMKLADEEKKRGYSGYNLMVSFYKKACSFGSMEGCYHYSFYIDSDQENRNLLIRACDNEFELACIRLKTMIER